jgi:hypothetical protein
MFLLYVDYLPFFKLHVLETTSGQLALLFNDSLTKPSPVRDLTNYI